jgi:uncharacterized protein (DUF2147 family)
LEADILILFAVAAAQLATHEPIEGLWRNPIGSAVIAVAPCGNALCGTIVWASERGRREVAKTTSRVVGTTVLTDLTRKGSGWAGKLFVPDDNIHVSARLQLLDNRKLKLTGCAVAELLCRSQIWTRT